MNTSGWLLDAFDDILEETGALEDDNVAREIPLLRSFVLALDRG